MKARRYSMTILFLIMAGVLVLLFGCNGDDGTGPDPVPVISTFSAAPADIMPGDSSLLSYEVSDADSLRVFPDGSRVDPADNGSFWVHPSLPTEYALVAYNSEGRDSVTVSVTMNNAVAQITQFELSKETILPDDSTVLTWKTNRADSIYVDGIRFTIDSAQVTFHAATTDTIVGYAYNDLSIDTAEVVLVVELPVEVVAPLGDYYTGVMGGSSQNPEMRFQVLDSDQNPLTLPVVHFSVVEGDGTLEADSAIPGLDGFVLANYNFSGTLGYAKIQATVPEVDSAIVDVRASVMYHGSDGQGQYVRIGDEYSAVLELNGTPADVAGPFDELYYVDYEDEKEVVFMVLDTDYPHDVIQSFEPVYGVIFTSGWTNDQFPEGVGIGSTIQEIRAAYGTPDTTWYDPFDPQYPDETPAQALQYFDLGLDFYCRPEGDSVVFEIHMTVVAPIGSGTPNVLSRRLHSPDRPTIKRVSELK